MHEGRELHNYIKVQPYGMDEAAKLMGVSRAMLYIYFNKDALNGDVKAIAEETLGIRFKNRVRLDDDPFLSNAKSNGRLDEHPYIEVPFVPIKARATFIEHESQVEEILDQVRVYGVSIEEAKRKKYIVIEVDGDSMDPQLKHGARVLAEYVDTGDWIYQTGVHAVLFKGYFVIKRIKENEILTKGYLTLHSDNEQGGKMQVKVEDIRHMWHVTRIIDSQVI